MRVKEKIEKKEVICAMAIFTVLIAVMTLTPVGYIEIPHLPILVAPFFVIVGAICYGPFYGLYLGTIFGVSSFIHCFYRSYEVGQLLLKESVLYTAICFIIPRMLMGFFCGCIYWLFKQNCSALFSSIVASFCGSFLHTIFFSTSVTLFFYNSAYIQSLGSNPTDIVRAIVNYNSYTQWVACTIVGSLVPLILRRIRQKYFAKNNKESDLIKT